RKARKKSEHVDVIAHGAMQCDHVAWRKPGALRHLCQIRGEFTIITDRHAPEGRGDAQVRLAIQEARYRALELAAGDHQWIVINHQRAKGRDRLDHARKIAQSQARIEAQDIVAEFPIDAVAKLDDEGTVPGGEEAHRHRVPWYTAGWLKEGIWQT